LPRYAARCWAIGVVVISVAAAIAVYVLARVMPPAILEPFRPTNQLLAIPMWLSGSAPAFFYTLAIGLLIALVAAPASARRHCVIWIAIALGFECLQLPQLSQLLSVSLAAAVPAPVWDLTASYWVSGTFDIRDLAATAAAGSLVFGFAHRFATGVIE
jgi:hypothetical protein